MGLTVMSPETGVCPALFCVVGRPSCEQSAFFVLVGYFASPPSWQEADSPFELTNRDLWDRPLMPPSNDYRRQVQQPLRRLLVAGLTALLPITQSPGTILGCDGSLLCFSDSLDHRRIAAPGRLTRIRSTCVMITKLLCCTLPLGLATADIPKTLPIEELPSSIIDTQPGKAEPGNRNRLQRIKYRLLWK